MGVDSEGGVWYISVVGGTPLMATTPLPVVSLNSLTAANIGEREDSDFGKNQLRDYIAKRKQYLGKVVAVSDSEKWESRGWDDGDTVYRRKATVWDGEAALTFDTDVVLYRNGRATAWDVDADESTMAEYYKWYLSVELPRLAAVEAAAEKGRALRDLEKAQASVVAPPALARGQTYKVVRGRKVPIGTTGKVFWWGDKGWGMSVGMNTSDRKDARGKNLDVVFVPLKNLEYVPNAQETAASAAAAAALTEDSVERQAAAGAAIRRGVEFYQDALNAWLKKTGYDGDSVRQRLIEIINDGVKKTSDETKVYAAGIALLALNKNQSQRVAVAA